MAPVTHAQIAERMRELSAGAAIGDPAEDHLKALARKGALILDRGKARGIWVG